jgi:glutaredoxin
VSIFRRRGGAPSDSTPRTTRAESRAESRAELVTLLTRPGCHLCDDAREVVARVAGELGVRWEEVDITSDPKLEAEYGEQIPVTFVDGRQHDFWRVDERRFRAALG